jgi:hypothetical protein
VRRAAADDLSPAPLGFVHLDGDPPWTTLDIRGAEKFPGLPPEKTD